MKLLGIIAISLTAALLQIHLLQMACGNLPNNMGLWITQQGWPGYRSRILGLWLIKLFGGDVRAFMDVTVGSLTIAGLLAWRLGGAGGLGILHACFAVFASPWFAPWDMLEPAIFLVFVVLVVEDWHPLWLMGLFAVAIFNLQSAMFIAGWMVLAGVWRSGLLCIAFGLAVMYWFQHTQGIGYGTFQCLDGHTTGISTDYAQERLVENLHKLFLWDNRMPLGIFVILGWAALKITRALPALGLTFLALLGATLVFGIVDELRCFLPLIPVLILAVKEN